MQVNNQEKRVRSKYKETNCVGENSKYTTKKYQKSADNNFSVFDILIRVRILGDKIWRR